MVHEFQQSGCLCAAKRTGRPELVNVFPTMFYTDFETAIIKAVTTMCPSCEVKMSFPFTTELVAEHTIFGTQQALWKIESELSQFLKKIFRLSPLPPAEFSDCIALDFVSYHPNDTRMEVFCNYLLENYIVAGSTFPPPV